MNELVISHMNAKVLKQLENYAHDNDGLQEALGRYVRSLGVTTQEHIIAVLEYLFRNRNHPSAEEIYGNLHTKMPSLTRTAVNSTLEVLAQLGAIQIIHVDSYETRFDGDTTPHAHLICSCCGDVGDIPLTSNVSRMLALPGGAVVEDIQLMCLGLCAKCNGSSNRNVN